MAHPPGRLGGSPLSAGTSLAEGPRVNDSHSQHSALPPALASNSRRQNSGFSYIEEEIVTRKG